MFEQLDRICNVVACLSQAGVPPTPKPTEGVLTVQSCLFIQQLTSDYTFHAQISHQQNLRQSSVRMSSLIMLVYPTINFCYTFHAQFSHQQNLRQSSMCMSSLLSVQNCYCSHNNHNNLLR
jgi:hypothetical protein